MPDVSGRLKEKFQSRSNPSFFSSCKAHKTNSLQTIVQTMRFFVAAAFVQTYVEAMENAMNIPTSTVISNHLRGGGRVEQMEIVVAGDNDKRVVALTFESRTGTYLADNAGVSWVDASIDQVMAAFSSGTVDELPDAKGVSQI